MKQTYKYATLFMLFTALVFHTTCALASSNQDHPDRLVISGIETDYKGSEDLVSHAKK